MPPRKKNTPPQESTLPNKPEQADQSTDQPDEQDDKQVTVPFGDNPAETATLLLAAAEESGAGQDVVRTGGGEFYVPASVAKKAGVEVKKDE